MGVQKRKYAVAFKQEALRWLGCVDISSKPDQGTGEL
jgi:hypothetical protein